MKKTSREVAQELTLSGAIATVRAQLIDGSINTNNFDMSVFNSGRKCRGHACGTAHCIGGWASILLGEKAADVSNYGPYPMDTSREFATSLYNLQYNWDPHNWEVSIHIDWKATITDKHAIKAIDNFLAGKPSPWNRVIKKSELVIVKDEEF